MTDSQKLDLLLEQMSEFRKELGGTEGRRQRIEDRCGTA